MITSLTDAQRAKFPEYVAKWTRIGLSCVPTSLSRVTPVVNAAYRVAGMETPKQVILCDGPVSAAIVAAILKDQPVRDSVWASVRDSVRASVWDSVGASVRASVWASVWDSVGASVRASVWDSVRASVWDSVGDSVWASVWDSVRASVWDSVGASVGASVWDSVRASVGASVWDSVRDSVWAMLYSSHDAGWISYVEFMRNELGLREQTEKHRPLTALCKLCGWWAPYKNVAIVQHRHCELHRDSDGRLHNESGMSVKYRDGWGVWSIHGVTVDEQVIMRPETQTVDQIGNESNEEVRRVRIERYGWERYLRESNAQVASTRFNERDRQPESLYVMKNGMKRLAVSDPSTGRRYCLGVPGEVETCEQAQSWMSHGLDRLAIHRS